ncbi:MAG: multicopper oxidase domain-containing protein [Balneolaceae bacterium]|nr:multicopper oxidase domain-containing protein [Balneolaceae bacterium]
MQLNKRKPISKFKVFLMLVLPLMMSMAVIQEVHACPACNALYKKEIETTLKETLVGKELMAAMEAQKNLPLDYAEATRHLFTENVQDPDSDFFEIIRRDEGLSIPQTSYVDQDVEADVSVTITLDEGLAYLGNGVVYDGFRTNGKIPGPTIRVTEGDIVEFIVENNGSIPHGASIHAAYTQTSKYLGEIPSGQSKSIKFRATIPGIYLYHCAPGGHAIPMHVMFGQYGMIIVEPAEQRYKLEEELGHGPDIEIDLIQHEWYASGKDAVEGNPTYVTFNGDIFKYVKDPITARPGDYVRINFMNVGPNLVSTFHLVGIVWDYAYWQGHPENVLVGGQTVTAGPSDTFVIEFRVPPDEGAYTILSHAVGSTSRGAIGLLVADRNADTPKLITSEGPKYTEEELAEFKENANRVMSPFRPGSPDIDPPAVYGDDTKDVTVSIIGNSYYPKTIEITPGTTVTWINEDVFSFLAGEFSGIHNVVSTEGPTNLNSPMLAHAETWSYTFGEEGEYTYICTPHPYMQGKVIVRAAERDLNIATIMWPMIPALFALGIAILALRKKPE